MIPKCQFTKKRTSNKKHTKKLLKVKNKNPKATKKYTINIRIKDLKDKRRDKIVIGIFKNRTHNSHKFSKVIKVPYDKFCKEETIYRVWLLPNLMLQIKRREFERSWEIIFINNKLN